MVNDEKKDGDGQSELEYMVDQSEWSSRKIDNSD